MTLPPTTTTVWDLVVVGAGPAGAAAALAARRARPRAHVLLVDRHDFPRDKSCGDGIAPHALDVLAGLGVRDAAAGHRGVHRLHLGYAPREDGSAPAVSGEMVRPTHVVPRRVFDARIVGAALEAGVEWKRATVRGVEISRGPAGAVVVDTGRERVRAHSLVVADGANGPLRRALGLGRNGEGHVAVAIRGYAPVLPQYADEQRIVFASRDWPAYAWSFPVGDGTANVGYGEILRGGRPLTRGHLLAALDALLPGVADDAHDWRAHHLPLSSHRPRQPDGPVLLAGDAASLINPMTGEGIYYAVLSGEAAGTAAVTAADPGRAYRTRMRRSLGTHLVHTTAATRLARIPGVVSAAVDAAGRDPEIFGSLVELGLGRGLLTGRTLTGLARSLVRTAPVVPAGLVRDR